jgi:branched-chain amino acid transport system permease protein
VAISPPADAPGDGSERVDEGTESGTESEPPTAQRSDGVSGTIRRFVADHAVHLVVIALFALYPLLYTQAKASPVGTELDVLLPRTRTMVVVLYFGLFAMSFDFISGYTGYLSFGHSLFYGIGGYFVVLTVNGKVPILAETTPLLLLLVVAGVFAAVVALLIGAVSFRLSGVYFAMITLGFAEVAHVFIRNWDHVSSNPADGALLSRAVRIGLPDWWILPGWNVKIGQIVGTEYNDVFGTAFNLSKADVSFYAVGIIVLLCYFAMQRIIHSPYGKVMIAIRENEERARAVGYNTFWYKMGAFAMSAFFAAIAGGLLAGYQRSVAPGNTFDLFVTADALLAAIIGGFGTLAGALYGVLFQDVLEGILSTEGHGLAPYLRDTLAESTMNGPVGDGIDLLLNGRAPLYIGIVFILFVLYVPEGILGTLRSWLGGPVAKKLPERIQRYRGK